MQCSRTVFQASDVRLTLLLVSFSIKEVNESRPVAIYSHVWSSFGPPGLHVLTVSTLGRKCARLEAVGFISVHSSHILGRHDGRKTREEMSNLANYCPIWILSFGHFFCHAFHRYRHPCKSPSGAASVKILVRARRCLCLPSTSQLKK